MNSEIHCWEWPRRICLHMPPVPPPVSLLAWWIVLNIPHRRVGHGFRTLLRITSTLWKLQPKWKAPGIYKYILFIFQMVKDPKRGWVTPKVRSPWGRGKQQSNVALVLCLHHTSKTDGIVLLHWNFSLKVYTITYWTPYLIKKEFLNL